MNLPFVNLVSLYEKASFSVQFLFFFFVFFIVFCADVLLPDDYKEPYKTALDKCKDSTGGAKNPCDAAYNVLVCFHAHNSKFTFAWSLLMVTYNKSQACEWHYNF